MFTLSHAVLEGFRQSLLEEERSAATVEKYMYAAQSLADHAGRQLYGKAQVVAFKKSLEENYAPATVNAMIAGVNRFLKFLGLPEWRLRSLKVQRAAFIPQEKELTRSEYETLVRTAMAEGNDRLAMILQTICATGLRVSELRFITVEAVERRCARISSKGKIREILLPGRLCKALKEYCKKHNIKSGAVFVTAHGKPVTRQSVWWMMKRLAKRAGVSPRKVFPHNLRRLFARIYYKSSKDIVRLADILGHRSVDTTRIYTARSQREQRRQLDKLALIL